MDLSVVDTERIRLRPLETKDASSLVEALNDWDTAQWLPTVPFPYRLEDATSFIADKRKHDPASGLRHGVEDIG